MHQNLAQRAEFSSFSFKACGWIIYNVFNIPKVKFIFSSEQSLKKAEYSFENKHLCHDEEMYMYVYEMLANLLALLKHRVVLQDEVAVTCSFWFKLTSLRNIN